MKMQFETDTSEEHGILLKEKNHILNEEVRIFFEDLETLFSNLPEKFTVKSENANYKIASEKYLLTNPNAPNSAKCMVSLVGNIIYEADLAIHLSKSVLYQSRIYGDKPWRLQQVQDCHNHIKCALFMLNTWNHEGLHCGDKLLKFLDGLMYHLKQSKDSLMIPRRKTLEELVKNPYKKCFNPALPNDVATSFYVQGHKLCLSVYHLCTNNSKVDISNKQTSESEVPWLNDVLIILSAALRKCQVLKSKVTAVKSLMF